ncbi:hypothetical protein HanPSC8_Chr06g0243501 [Helianthus annuus]|nr:hypothetical protein HanPSC8_Chr06g0243501 [Helianthus annuus]
MMKPMQVTYNNFSVLNKRYILSRVMTITTHAKVLSDVYSCSPTRIQKPKSNSKFLTMSTHHLFLQIIFYILHQICHRYITSILNLIDQYFKKIINLVRIRMPRAPRIKRMNFIF